MTRRRAHGYTLWTSHGTGSYRTWKRAVAAARWAAGSTSAEVLLGDDGGTTWDVSPDGQVSRRPV
jgi:hypothetical protein